MATMDWLQGFLTAHQRNLGFPDGRPLYAYQLQQIEFEFLRSLLTTSLSVVAGKNHWASGTDRLFVLYAGEWFRRRYEGGVWKWEDLTASLEWDNVSHAQCQQFVISGMKYWKRDLFRHESGQTAYLMTVVTEGGFPMRLVNQSHTHLSRYLKTILNDYSQLAGSAIDVYKIAEAHANRLPASFRKQPVYQLAGDTVAAVYKYAAELSDKLLITSKSPYEELEERIPDWKRHLPISLEDEGAKSLVNGLLKTAKRKQQSRAELIVLQRFFKNVPSDCGWKHEGRIELPSALSIDWVAGQIDRSREDSPRRLELSVQYGSRVVPIASLTREAEQYFIYPYGLDCLSLELLPEEEVCCFLMEHGGAKLGELTISGGAALDLSLPITCVLDNQRLMVIASGSAKSPCEYVYSCIPPGTELQSEQAQELDWQSAHAPGRWFKITEVATVALSDGFHCKIQPKTDAGKTLLCTISGQRLYSYERGNTPCFAGFPYLYYWQQGRSLAVSNDEFYWRSLSTSGGWQTIRHKQPKGRINYRVVVNDECIHSGTMIIVPDEFTVQLHQGKKPSEGELFFSGLNDAQVHLCSGVNIDFCTENTSSGVLACCSNQGEFLAKISVDLIWPDLERAQLSVPFPGQGAHFTSTSGTAISGSKHCLESLVGYSAVVVGAETARNYELIGSLRAKDIPGEICRSLTFRSPIRLDNNHYAEYPLVDVLNRIRELFSYSADLDAVVVLEIICAGVTKARLDVGQFSSELLFNPELKQIQQFDLTNAVVEMPFDTRLISMAGEEVPEITSQLVNGDGGYAHQLNFSVKEEGPAMAIVPGASVRSIRPCIVYGSENAVEYETQELGAIFRISNARQRLKQLHRYFDLLESDPRHFGWQQLIQSVRRFAEVHPDSLDLYEAMIDRPDIMAGLLMRMKKEEVSMLMAWEDYLPFRWWQVPIDAFGRAYEGVKQSSVIDDEDLIELITARALGNLSELIKFSVTSKAVVETFLSQSAGFPESEAYAGVRQLTTKIAYLEFLDKAFKQDLYAVVGDSYWPSGLNRQDWDQLFETEIAWLDTSAQGNRKAFLDAIIAQAYSLASGEYLPREYRAFICSIREFCPEHFDKMMKLAVIIFYMSSHHGK